jgi:hypothetical protein
MLSVLAIGSKVLGFKPDKGAGVLRAIKICSTPPFGGNVKTVAPCCEILRHVKSKSMNEILRIQNPSFPSLTSS